MLDSLKPICRKLARQMVHGSRFRLYAPQSPAAMHNPPFRIAIISLIPFLGDSVLLFPLIDAIRREHPQAELSVFTAGSGSILSHHAGVDHVHVLKHGAAWWKRTVVANIHDIWSNWRTDYASFRFNICAVPRGGVDPFHSAHLAWMLGGEVRAGYSTKFEPELAELDLGATNLLTTVVRDQGGIHELTRGAEVLALAGVLRHPVELSNVVESMRMVAQSRLGEQYIAQWPQLAAPYAIVAPGASIARKRWAPDSFAELVQTEMLDRKITPVFIGSPSERALCESIAAKLRHPPLILTGTTFVQLAALCLGAQFFIGNDSGPGHVAGSLGTVTVEASAFPRSGDPLHHSAPNRSHPCGPWVTVVQPAAPLAPCTVGCVAPVEHCISQISVAEMRHALHELLDARQSSKVSISRSSTALREH
jgi:ADP-heptose:LPS heptosyltransferase